MSATTAEFDLGTLGEGMDLLVDALRAFNALKPRGKPVLDGCKCPQCRLDVVELDEGLTQLSQAAAQVATATTVIVDRSVDHIVRLAELVESLSERVAELEADRETGGEGE